MRILTTKSTAQPPLFVKTHGFLSWLVPLTLKCPKARRFLLTERLGSMGLDFYDCIVEAVLQPAQQAGKLELAVRRLAKIRLFCA